MPPAILPIAITGGMMILAYIRVSKSGPTEAEQRAVLAAHAEDMRHHCYVDVERGARPWEMRLRQREIVTQACRPGQGDVIAITAADRLGRSFDDALLALREITARGAAVLDCETGDMIRATEGLAEAVAFLARAAGLPRQRSSQKATATKLARGNLGGKPPQLQGKRRQLAVPIWADKGLTAEQARAAIKEKLGLDDIALRTLYRTLGTRGGERPGRSKR